MEKPSSTSNGDGTWPLWLRLRHTRGMNRNRMNRLLDAFGDPETLFGLSAQDILTVPGFSEDAARDILTGVTTVDVEQELDRIHTFGVRLILRDSAEYPANLRGTPPAPALLYVMGDLEADDRFSVTIVGTRNTTGYGVAMCETVAGELADAGLTVISGLAAGIDAVAHQTALRREGRTVAVVGTGLARVYPPQHEDLAWRIRNQGALLSEYGMDTPPDRYNFPERNEVMAGLSLATIVVEAPTRSGALLTTRAAMEMGRSVYAVPGDVTRANSRGCNGLIREGATLIGSGAHVLEDMHDQLKDLMGQRRESGRPDRGASAAQPAVAVEMSFEETQVLDLVRRDAAHFDQLYERARGGGVEVDAAKLSTILLQLELKGCIRQAPGKMFVAEGEEDDDDGLEEPEVRGESH